MKRKSLLAVMSFWLAMTLSACGKQALEEPVVVEQRTVAESKEVQTEQNTGAGETETKEDTPHKTQESESTHQGLKYGFADAKEGAAYIKANKDYLEGLTQNDLDFRMQKKDATLEEYIAFAEQQVRDFTEKEKEGISACMQSIWEICEKNQYTLPDIGEVTFVKTTMQEEAGATAYTHGTHIYVGEGLISFLSSNYQWARDYGTTILVHELFHCLTRNDAGFREDMYGIIGFSIQEEEFAFSKEVREQMLSNPDVGKHNSYATFRIDGKDRECVVVLASTRPFQKSGDNMFNLMMVGLVPLDDLSVMYPSDSAENFWEVFGRNTDYVIDPEEALADNFSYAVMYGVNGMSYPSPEIIQEICDYLKR